MIERSEAAEWAGRMGVSHAQVERDHLVSFILAWLADDAVADEVTFIGGTALARTYLDGTRVSEDMDLLTSDVGTVQIAVQERLPRALRREYPGLAVSRPSPGPRGVTMFAQAADGPVVQLQILEAEAPEIRLEVARTPVSLRYGRLPSTADLIVPTPPSFVAMKVAAYRDRTEPRDLFDLARLAERGHMTTAALALERTV